MIKTTFIVMLTFLFAFILMILPLPAFAQWLQPCWVILVAIYWAMALPHRVSVGIAWLVGLFLDANMGSLLGEHALALCVITYFVAKSYHRLRLFPVWQQALVILGLLVFYQLIIFWAQSTIHRPPDSLWYWASPITSMLVWPWILQLLRSTRRQFKLS